MKITILKPDHLGDLVLSSPAINKILEIGQEVILFCNPDSIFLANFLFPNLNTFPISFPHLSKNNFSENYKLFYGELQKSDCLINLRCDEKINEIILNKVSIKNYIAKDSLDLHETLLQKQGIQELTGDYDIESYFYRYGYSPKKIPKTPKDIGLIISAGFFNNSLSIYKWFEYSKYFIEKFNAHITVIAGPSEKSDAAILNQLIPSSKVIIGGKDISLFLNQIKNLDLIISTDSGTSHIASLSGVPIISLFGPSPYKRYRPIGPYNQIVSLNFNCSPCPQFEIMKVNKCISKECLNSIDITDLIKKLPYQE